MKHEGLQVESSFKVHSFNIIMVVKHHQGEKVAP
jgi:hypothetical protein